MLSMRTSAFGLSKRPATGVWNSGGVMILVSFILLVLFVTGIVGTGMQLFGGPNVNNLCNEFVGGMRQYGAGVDTGDQKLVLNMREDCEVG